MKRLETTKRVCVLLLGLVGLLMQSGVYAYIWLDYYYPIVNNFNRGLKFYQNGHLLIIGIYFVLLFFFTNTYGGLKIGYLKTVDVFLSQMFSLLIVNVITYFQISLMNNNLVPPDCFMVVTIIQLVIAGTWTAVCNAIYRKAFPPREMLLIHGERDIDDILRKFASRKDKYKIVKCIDIKEGLLKLEEEIDKGYGAVVLWDIPTEDRNRLLKYCYSRFIRVYMMPKIPDVLIKGSDQLHLFDTPILLTREYALKVEQRVAKRLIDVVCALLLLIIASPFMLITAIVIKCYDGGPVLYKQIRCTQGGKEFRIMKFRSMRVDAEKDGVARLASKNDSRITPVGKFIRAVRIDELPQLFNILKGDMSFIGPRPERPEIIKQYVEEMPEFVFRMKVKAGLAGYAQVYGKYNTTPYDKLKLDLSYIENYSVWLDLKLMLLTLKILITPESTEGVDNTQVTAMKSLKAGEPIENEKGNE
ncbi:MAG: exopolysaccharide biosynthesis polyprenyl glycosylphosphotransferase [Firmicutes bacterium]|nr:exopolysaccharide biosynthesis polyprenyl glycosylphosphotransferase [Bacillota bacterium]